MVDLGDRKIVGVYGDSKASGKEYMTGLKKLHKRVGRVEKITLVGNWNVHHHDWAFEGKLDVSYVRGRRLRENLDKGG